MATTGTDSQEKERPRVFVDSKRRVPRNLYECFKGHRTDFEITYRVETEFLRRVADLRLSNVSQIQDTSIRYVTRRVDESAYSGLNVGDIVLPDNGHIGFL